MKFNGSQEGVIGVTEIFGHVFDTTGVLGVSGAQDSEERGIFRHGRHLPGYQDLATGRHWHFSSRGF